MTRWTNLATYVEEMMILRGFSSANTVNTPTVILTAILDSTLINLQLDTGTALVARSC
jgi:hypothetical protein